MNKRTKIILFFLIMLLLNMVEIVKADTLVSTYRTNNSQVELYKRTNTDGSTTTTMKSKSTNAKTGIVTETVFVEIKKNGKTISTDIKKYVNGQLDASFSNKNDAVTPSSNKYAKTNNQNLQPVEQINQGTNRYQRSDRQNQIPTNNYQQPASNLQQLNTSNRYARTYQQADNEMLLKTDANKSLTNDLHTPSERSGLRQCGFEEYNYNEGSRFDPPIKYSRYLYTYGRGHMQHKFARVYLATNINKNKMKVYNTETHIYIVFDQEATKGKLENMIEIFKTTGLGSLEGFKGLHFVFADGSEYGPNELKSISINGLPLESIVGTSQNENIVAFRGRTAFKYQLGGGFDTLRDEIPNMTPGNAIILGKGINYDNISVRGRSVDILDSNKNIIGGISFDNSVKRVDFEEGCPFLDKPIFDLMQKIAVDKIILSNAMLGHTTQEQEYVVPDNYTFVSLYGNKKIHTLGSSLFAYTVDSSMMLYSKDTITSDRKSVKLFIYADKSDSYSYDPKDHIDGKYLNPDTLKFDCLYSKIQNTNDLMIVLPLAGERKIIVKDFFTPEFSIRLQTVFAVAPGSIKVLTDYKKEDIINIINNQSNTNQENNEGESF